MKVILKENIENLGRKGDIVRVADGYGRNYLIPRNLALEVTPSNMKMIETEQRVLKKKLEKEIQSYQSLIDKLNQVSLSFKRKAGEKDVIFGSVTAADIQEGLERLGFEVEKKRILLEEPFKRLGNYTVPLKIFQDQQAEIKVEIKREGSSPEEEEGKEEGREAREDPAPDEGLEIMESDSPEVKEDQEEGADGSRPDVFKKDPSAQR